MNFESNKVDLHSDSDPFNYVAREQFSNDSMIHSLPGVETVDLSSNLEVALLFQAAQIQRLRNSANQRRIQSKGMTRTSLDRHSYQIQIKQLTVVIEQLKQEKAGMNKYLNQMNAALQSRMNSSKGSNTSHNQSQLVMKLNKKYQKALLEIEKMYNDNSSLQQQLNQLNQQIKKNQGKPMINVPQSNIMNNKDNAVLHQQIRNLQNQLQIYKDNQRKLTEEIQLINEYKNKQYEQRIQILQTANKQYEIIVKNYDQQIQRCRDEIHRQQLILVGEHTNQNTSVNKIRQEYLKKQEELQNKIALLSQELQRLTLKADERQNKIKLLQDQNANISDNFKEMMNQKDLQIKKLAQNEKNLLQKLQRKDQELSKHFKDANSDSQRIIQLEKSLQYSKYQSSNIAASKSSQNIINIYRSQIEELENQLKQLVQKFNEQARIKAQRDREHFDEVQILRKELNFKNQAVQRLEKTNKESLGQINNEIKAKDEQIKTIYTNLAFSLNKISQQFVEMHLELNRTKQSLEESIINNSSYKLRNILDCITDQISMLSKQIMLKVQDNMKIHPNSFDGIEQLLNRQNNQQREYFKKRDTNLRQQINNKTDNNREVLNNINRLLETTYEINYDLYQKWNSYIRNQEQFFKQQIKKKDQTFNRTRIVQQELQTTKEKVYQRQQIIRQLEQSNKRMTEQLANHRKDLGREGQLNSIKQKNMQVKFDTQIRHLKQENIRMAKIIRDYTIEIEGVPKQNTQIRQMELTIMKKAEQIEELKKLVQNISSSYNQFKRKLKIVEQQLQQLISLFKKDQQQYQFIQKRAQQFERKYFEQKSKCLKVQEQKQKIVRTIQQQVETFLHQCQQQSKQQNKIQAPMNFPPLLSHELIKLQKQFEKLACTIHDVRLQNIQLNRILYDENTSQFVWKQFSGKKLGQLNQEIDRVSQDNMNLKEELLICRLQLMQDLSIQRRKQENLGLFVLLFAQIESLRNQLRQRN